MTQIPPNAFASFARQLDSAAAFSIHASHGDRDEILVVVPDIIYAPAREILDKFQQHQPADERPWDLVEMETLGYVEQGLQLGLPDLLLKFTSWEYHSGNQSECERVKALAESVDGTEWSPAVLTELLEDNLQQTCRDLDVALATMDRALSRDLYLRSILACLKDEPDMDRVRWIHVLANYQDRIRRLEDEREGEHLRKRWTQFEGDYRLNEAEDEKLSGLAEALGLHYKHRDFAEGGE